MGEVGGAPRRRLAEGDPGFRHKRGASDFKPPSHHGASELCGEERKEEKQEGGTGKEADIS